MKVHRSYTTIVGTFLAVGLIAGLVSTAQTYAYTEIEVTNGGNITGRVTFDGDMPPVKMLNVNKDSQVCGHGRSPSEALIISSENQGIRNAVVSIENIEKGKMIDVDLVPKIDQEKCVFKPHVLAIPAGTKVDLLNSDETLHNVHTFAIRNSPFNIAVLHGKTIRRRFMTPEVVRMKCDIHKWMNAYVVVKGNPYFAVTDENGGFKIEDIPPGTYRLQVWHEELGENVKDVTVEAGKGVRADFQLTAK